MATDLRLKENLHEITEAIVATYVECRHINHLGHKPLPSREAVVDILADLMDILYPGYVRRQNLHIGNVEYHIGDLVDGLHDKLTLQIARALRHECDDPTVMNGGLPRRVGTFNVECDDREARRVRLQTREHRASVRAFACIPQYDARLIGRR